MRLLIVMITPAVLLGTGAVAQPAPVRFAVGRSPATPVRTCALPAPIGTGHSCRMPGAGSVVGPWIETGAMQGTCFADDEEQPPAAVP